MMQKLMNRRNRKGFTLIELIVVIAILAILAAIAIPRFAGFTDKAKLAADNEYANLVAHSVSILMIDGSITSGGTLTIAATTGAASTDATLKSGFVFANEIILLVPQKALQKHGAYTIVIGADGSYTPPS